MQFAQILDRNFGRSDSLTKLGGQREYMIAGRPPKRKRERALKLSLSSLLLVDPATSVSTLAALLRAPFKVAGFGALPKEYFLYVIFYVGPLIVMCITSRSILSIAH